MSKLPLDKLTLAELQVAQVEIAALIEQRKISERESLKGKIAALAQEGGFSLDELFGGRGKKALKVVALKYRNPAGTETWSGRGRQGSVLAGTVALHTSDLAKQRMLRYDAGAVQAGMPMTVKDDRRSLRVERLF